MIVQNPANAFVLVHSEKTSVACDPWITDGIYEGAWRQHPPVGKARQDLGWVDAVLITHIHADHLDPAALELTGEAQVVLPELYPNRAFCTRRLPASVQRRLRFVPVSVPFAVGDLTLEFVPPMNRYGHKVDLYGPGDLDVPAIDTGIIVSDGDSTAVLLADNFPYHLPAAGDSLERMVGCDALFFPYNACADDYPVCHDNMTLPQKQVASLKRNQQRLEWLKEAFISLHPRVTVPYSSDFLLAGRRALEFLSVHPPEFVDKRLAAWLYERASGVSSLAMFEGDSLALGGKMRHVTRGRHFHLDLRQAAERLFTEQLPASLLQPASDDRLRDLFFPASAHMLKRASASTWSLELESADTGLVMSVDLARAQAHLGQASDRSHVLRCTAPSGYLASLLSFETHWDNAMIGHHLSWHRQPDEYDVGLYKALNYLHVPLGEAQ